jgi:hypothetical protein
MDELILHSLIIHSPFMTVLRLALGIRLRHSVLLITRRRLCTAHLRYLVIRETRYPRLICVTHVIKCRVAWHPRLSRTLAARAISTAAIFVARALGSPRCRLAQFV